MGFDLELIVHKNVFDKGTPASVLHWNLYVDQFELRIKDPERKWSDTRKKHVPDPMKAIQ